MKLQHKPHNAACIITPCAALHNVALLGREPELLGLYVPTSRCRHTGEILAKSTCHLLMVWGTIHLACVVHDNFLSREVFPKDCCLISTSVFLNNTGVRTVNFETESNGNCSE